jgi:predicted ATPase
VFQVPFKYLSSTFTQESDSEVLTPDTDMQPVPHRLIIGTEESGVLQSFVFKDICRRWLFHNDFFPIIHSFVYIRIKNTNCFSNSVQSTH